MAAPVAQSNVPSCSYDARVLHHLAELLEAARAGRPPSTASPSAWRSVGRLRRDCCVVPSSATSRGTVIPTPGPSMARRGAMAPGVRLRSGLSTSTGPASRRGSDAGVDPGRCSPAFEPSETRRAQGASRGGLVWGSVGRPAVDDDQLVRRHARERVGQGIEVSGHRRGAVVGHHDDADGSGDVRRSHAPSG